MKSPHALLLLLLALWFASGCAHTEKTVSYKFVDMTYLVEAPARDGKLEVKQGETVFVDAKPLKPLAAPGYPKDTVVAKADETVTVSVRILVGIDGRVEDVHRSIADLSPLTPFGRACFEAVQDAVAQWKFEPAQLAVVKPQPNGRPLIVSSTPTERPFEVAFTFSSGGGVGAEFSKTQENRGTERP